MKVFILILHCIILSNSLLACTCSDTPSVRKGIRKSDHVIVGEIVAIKEITISNTSPLFREPHQMKFNEIKIKVKSIYKGRVLSDTMYVFTNSDKEKCGNIFEIGSTYIIYAYYANFYGNDNSSIIMPLYTNKCTRTCKMNAKEIVEIEKIRKPKKIPIS